MKHISAFQAYGIELEYMIVDRDTLQIRPITDRVMEKATGEITGDFENGRITWSNELVLHVIELKTSGPDVELSTLAPDFQKNVTRINEILESENAMLMPTGMHPSMKPDEKRLWPHDNNEIYEAYDRIFDCRGHGWSNLQSMHINLPFANDEEFRTLHTAIRFLLPVLPSLTASSPIVEDKQTGFLDSRLVEYQQNQKRIPSIAGHVIPEPVTSKAEYQTVILNKTYEDIAPHDPEELMREDWLNSRGAIARFERQTIEIRILDTQECPAADLAIAEFVVVLLKDLIAGRVSFEKQISPSTPDLKTLFDQIVREGENANISKFYLDAWNLSEPMNAAQFWKKLWSESKAKLSPNNQTTIEQILKSGTLASRILRAVKTESLPNVYRRLSQCLASGELFT